MRPVPLTLLPLLLAACGGAALPISPAPLRLERDSPVQGAWDLVRESTEPDGDRRTERIEWHLHARAGRLHGFVSRSLSWRTVDGVPYRCNGQLHATRSWRSVVEGVLGPTGRTGELRVISSANDATACAGAERDPSIQESCQVAVLAEARLSADCGSGGIQLARRLESPVPIHFAIHGPEALTGIWTWHHRSVDAEGDTKVEAEVWRLEQYGARVRGHYERSVVVRSGDGRRFQCNGALQYTNESRFEISGKVEGRKLRIRELSFRARPHRCETGTRTLDEYDGALVDGRVIRLSWGRGAQLLHRRF